MPNSQFLVILAGLIGLTYLLFLAVLATGIFKLVKKESASLSAVHRWAAIPAIFFLALVHLGGLLIANKVVFTVPTFFLFLLMVFGGATTGRRLKNGGSRILHLLFGFVTFVLFTMFIFRFLLQPV